MQKKKSNVKMMKSYSKDENSSQHNQNSKINPEIYAGRHRPRVPWTSRLSWSGRRTRSGRPLSRPWSRAWSRARSRARSVRTGQSQHPCRGHVRRIHRMPSRTTVSHIPAGLPHLVHAVGSHRNLNRSVNYDPVAGHGFGAQVPEVEGKSSWGEVVAADVVRVHHGTRAGSRTVGEEGLRTEHSSPCGVDSPSDPVAGTRRSSDECDGEG